MRTHIPQHGEAAKGQLETLLGDDPLSKAAAEARFVHPIGDLPLDQGALIEPLAVGLHAVKHAGVVEGGTAVIDGAGPIGLLTAAILQAKGMKVVMSEVSAARKDIARSTGVADLVVDPAEQDLAEAVREFTDGVGADVAFDAAGIKPVIDALLESLRPGGRLEVHHPEDPRRQPRGGRLHAPSRNGETEVKILVHM